MLLLVLCLATAVSVQNLTSKQTPDEVILVCRLPPLDFGFSQLVRINS